MQIMPKVLVTGAGGQLGQAFSHVLERSEERDSVALLSRAQLDICDMDSIAAAFDVYQPEVVINAAAYTAVDAAEKEVERAFAVNEAGAAFLALACQRSGVDLIQLSTDYVFDGSKNIPYEVTDTPAPVNVYGQSKLAGEFAVRAAHPNAIIVRTAWLYSPFAANFQTKIIEAARLCLARNQALRVIHDQWGSPTYAPDLVHFLLRLVSLRKSYRGQLLHFSNNQMMSRLEQAKMILHAAVKCGELARLPEIVGVGSEAFEGLALRPRNSALKASRLEGDSA